MNARLHLIIDADDTLWENNIFFERAFTDFCEYLGHSRMSPGEVRAVLDEIEIANAKIHGYGSLNFGRNLKQCYERLVERHLNPEDLPAVMALAERLLDHPMLVIEGVEETLGYLAPRHDLTLFTKGDPDEQKMKLDRSGLAVYFGHTAIVKEKNAAAYAELVAHRRMDPARAWMIGNSPKSDINPALAAGLSAVFIPHPHTWSLEQEEVLEIPGKLIVLERFSDLRYRF